MTRYCFWTRLLRNKAVYWRHKYSTINGVVLSIKNGRYIMEMEQCKTNIGCFHRERWSCVTKILHSETFFIARQLASVMTSPSVVQNHGSSPLPTQCIHTIHDNSIMVNILEQKFHSGNLGMFELFMSCDMRTMTYRSCLDMGPTLCTQFPFLFQARFPSDNHT